MSSFEQRLARLPRLGVGISAEPDSARAGTDAVHLREEAPGLVHFLEYGTDVVRGLDEHVRRWAGLGLPTTYHFLDLNLAEREDVRSRIKNLLLRIEFCPLGDRHSMCSLTGGVRAGVCTASVTLNWLSGMVYEPS